VLLLPIGFGCILANLGMAASANGDGFLSVLYRAGIQSELFPLLIFIGRRRHDRFQPSACAAGDGDPGAAGQFGIYGTLILATLLGFNLNEAAPSVCSRHRWPDRDLRCRQTRASYAAPIAVAAYSLYEPHPHHPAAYHEADDTRKERLIRMEYSPKPVSRKP
jgi:oxaloacetate decarboxylase beta subunit